MRTRSLTITAAAAIAAGAMIMLTGCGGGDGDADASRSSTTQTSATATDERFTLDATRSSCRHDPLKKTLTFIVTVVNEESLHRHGGQRRELIGDGRGGSGRDVRG
jgi:hypothetical protein